MTLKREKNRMMEFGESENFQELLHDMPFIPGQHGQQQRVPSHVALCTGVCTSV